MGLHNLPNKQGLYDPQLEKDSCGVGFVCDIKGRKKNEIVKSGLEVLRRLAHRGAVGADPKTGDGAGILIQIPHEFFAEVCKKENITLGEAGTYGTGLVFLSRDTKARKACKEAFEKIIKEENQTLLGWRKVPVDNSDIGKTARITQPVIEQIFIAKHDKIKDQLDFERRLYIIRRRAENAIRSRSPRDTFFYVTNISCRTFSYKGLLMPHQLDRFFIDLRDTRIASALCMVHSRYSTNTFPTWDLAQPFRFLAHNGEINTLRGNINWMRARENRLKSELFGKDIEKIKPVIVPGGSDSATIDNVFELLVLSGKTLAHAITMLIPSAWGKYSLLSRNFKDFFKYHASFMEPWDGPAAITFTDGTRIGAVLDRNGLRPARYIVTGKDVVIMASEVGVLDIEPGDILVSGKLEPGKIFFIDTEKKRIVNDKDIKESMSRKSPYTLWNRKFMVELDKLPAPRKKPKRPAGKPGLLNLLKAFGYTREDLKVVIKPMAETGKEPIGSMGNDTPLAILSKRPRMLYGYFKQLFAQVTNPAIDPIREGFVMSMRSFIGFQDNILSELPEHSRKLDVRNPILADEDLRKIRNIKKKGFRARTISLVFRPDDERDFPRTLDRICKESEKAIKSGISFIILSDRFVNGKYAAVPALLATGCVHHYLIKKALRTRTAIIVESGEPREVHHFALLFGYGADCVNPYLAYEAIGRLKSENRLEPNIKKARKNYRKAVYDGILKILSKMGISTIRSYKGAQIFEAVGLNEKVIERCFTGTPSRIGGAGFDVIAKEKILMHKEAFPEREIETPLLATGGVYKWQKDGEFHLWNPASISCLQDAVRNNDYEKYREFAELINNQSGNPTTLRSLFKFKKRKPADIDEVEPVEEIVKRFATGAMSFGSISGPAHETLAIAMNRMGARSNTGEGGEDPVRFQRLANGDSKRSAIKQVASGRFGVAINYLVNADELQIKIAQGAKPGEGGQLPGHKVSAVIAKTRYTTPGVTLISPPPHHDIYSIEDLAELIFDLKNANPNSRISVKLVSEVGVGTVAAGVAKGHADMILISGGDGGTGASPLSSIHHAGLPWELGLSEAHQTLVLNDLRSRVRLQVDGQIRTGRDVAIAAILGAEEYGFSTSALVAVGCVMLRHCHLNNCSVGVATQEEILAKRFRGRPEYIVNYFRFVAGELREIMATLGIRRIEGLIGRTDLLEMDGNIVPWKAKELDYSRILYKPRVPQSVGMYCTEKQNHAIDKVLDRKLIALSKNALEKAEKTSMNLGITNKDRTTGAMLSSEICKAYGEEALPEDTIHCKFKGVAGQSFASWLAKGVTFELEGLANDYVGKGISGGKVIIYPDKKSAYRPEENIIIGNTTFYGAISGEAYVRGMAGERFCIRNSGLYAVVEGVGDHGCEYMTGGRVLVIGRTGRNFAAGMSGGIAYVYDENGTFKSKCNTDMVFLERCGEEDKKLIYNLLQKHYNYTQSGKARDILDNLEKEMKRFIKVIPVEYKHILEEVKVEEKLDLSEVSDG